MAALSPQDRIALAAATVGALVLHAWALTGPSTPLPPRAVEVWPVLARVVSAPAPGVESPPTKPGPEPSAAPRPRQTAPHDDHRDDPSEAPVTTPESPATASAASAEPAPPRRADTPAVLDVRPVPALLALPLRGAGALTYALTVNGQPGEASLSFRIENGRYDLLLERRAGDRDLPSWHSEGRVGPQGLTPERHRVRRQGRERELIVFDRETETPRLLVGARAYALSAGTQDRLSWWLQLSALMAAEPDPHLGLRLRIPVAGPQGAIDWDFEVAARQGDRWLLRREKAAGAGRPALAWTAWLDGQRAFLPIELSFSLDDDEQWALRLLEGAETVDARIDR